MTVSNKDKKGQLILDDTLCKRGPEHLHMALDMVAHDVERAAKQLCSLNTYNIFIQGKSYWGV